MPPSPVEPDFDSFDHDDAWRLGSSLVARCEGLPVTIAIHLGEQRVFHAALAGTSADNDDWVLRKIRVVRRFDRSSLEVGEIYAEGDVFPARFGLPPSEYAPVGGAVPIRVHGSLVGVVAVSGLPSADDHAHALAALRDAHASRA